MTFNPLEPTSWPKTVCSIDSETELIRPGVLAPRPVCFSYARDDGDFGLVHHTEALPFLCKLFDSHVLIVGHHIAYDTAVACAEWPQLIPIVFEVYEANRVSDTGIREKLNHIAGGIYHKFERTDGSWEHLDYALDDLVRRHTGVQLQKEGGWRLRFGELRDVPLAFWPEDAKNYAMGDAVGALRVWQKQQEEPLYLEDEFRQSRAEFWLYLMSCWGLTTDLQGVREFARKTQIAYDAIASELLEAGLIRPKGKNHPGKFTRNVKVVQARVAAVYSAAGKRVEMTKGGKKGAAGAKPKTDADVCDRSGDPILEKYAELSSLTTTLTANIPLLEKGMYTPLQPRFEVLVASGRTSSSPNVQNPKTDIGMRECFVPRPGHVYISADFSGFELRTWSQVCIKMGFGSRMAEALNAGNDPHLEIARRILGISYEEARLDYKNDPHGRVYLPRQSGKICNFGRPGGLGPHRLVEYARKNYGVIITEAHAEELSQFWLDSWPEARAYFDWVNTTCKQPNPQARQLFSNRVRGNLGFCDCANCLDDETEALTQRGWVKGFDLQPGEKLLTKNAKTGALEWHPAYKVFKYPKYRGPLVEFKTKNFSAVTTPNHRWLVNTKKGEAVCKTTEEIGKNGDFRIHRSGSYSGTPTSPYTDDFVELVGWVLTDGSICKDRIVVYQSERGNPENVKRIDRLFARLKVKHARTTHKQGAVRWTVYGGCHLLHILRQLFPERVLSISFLLQLTKSQLELLWTTMMRGDGTCKKRPSLSHRQVQQQFFTTGVREAADVFQVLCTMVGLSSLVRWKEMAWYRPKKSKKIDNQPRSKGVWSIVILKRDTVQVVNLSKMYGKSKQLTMQRREYEASARVWCPSVQNTYFVARRNGSVYITGNTYFQGLAADAAKAACFLVTKACYAEPESPLFGCRPVNFIHDEDLLESPEERAPEAAEELARLMKLGAAPFLPDVPPVVEPMVARRWSKAAKPMRDANGRLIPWDFPAKVAE